MAARLASWLLVREKSWRAVLEEVRVTRHTTDAGARDDLQQELQVVEHAVARKILERSWVHRQATRWTGDGRAEHFLVVRADTAALRTVAGEDLEQYLADRREGLGRGSTRPADGELRWITLGLREDPRTDEDRNTQRPSSPVSRLYDLVGFSPGPPLKRFVFSWRADPTVDSLSLGELPLEANLGLRLTPPASGWYAALGVRYRRRPDRRLRVSASGSTFAIERPQTIAPFLLLGAPGQLVPAYAGFRYEWSSAGPVESFESRDSEVGVFGLGYPEFVELKNRRLRNLWVQAGLVPRFRSVTAGGRVVLTDPPGVGLHILFRLAADVSDVGFGSTGGLALEAKADDRVFTERLAAEGGLELRLGGRLGVFGLGRLDRLELARGSGRQAKEYAHLFRSFETVSQAETETGLRVGLRLAF